MIDTRAINAASPVNWQHSLNVGRQVWWIVMPGALGGGTWRDITNHKNVGVLTSMGNINNGFKPTTRLGGWGSMLFDGTAGYIAGPSVIGPQHGMSCAAWARISSFSANGLLVSMYNQNLGNAYLQFAYLSTGAGFARIQGSGIDTNYIGRSTAGGLLSANIWYRLLMTWDGGTSATGINYYINGIQLASVISNGGSFVAPNSTSIPIWIGAQEAATPVSFSFGSLDDVSIWSRAISAAEVRQDFLLSQFSYPGVLNRLPITMTRGATANIYRPQNMLLAFP